MVGLSKLPSASESSTKYLLSALGKGGFHEIFTLKLLKSLLGQAYIAKPNLACLSEPWVWAYSCTLLKYVRKATIVHAKNLVTFIFFL